MKLMIIGATGLLGSALKRTARAGITVLPEDHETLEITDRAQLERALLRAEPDAVVNAAVFQGVAACAELPQHAFAVNARAVRDLAGLCNELGITLVQISTNAVFDGQRGDYCEHDPPNPVNTYGVTKFAGELYAANICERHYIVRLPILFGTRENRGTTFIEKMHGLVRNGSRHLRVAADEVSCPSYTDDVAGGIMDLIASGRGWGVYHIKNEGRASLYEFTATFFERMGLDVTVEKAEAGEFGGAAPELKPLDISIRSVKLPCLRPWTEALDAHVAQLRTGKDSRQ